MKHSRSGSRTRGANRSVAVAVLFRCFAFCLLLTGCIVAVRWVTRAHDSAVIVGDTSSGLNTFLDSRPAWLQSRNRRLVYPYSIVPGGVASAEELREAAAHDPTIAAHYAGFDYQRAHIVEVKHPELVYLSFRRGNHIYWTSKQASLHMGEKLITDGRITARTRCGNQVSVLPQAKTTPEEPTIAELDRPDAIASGMQRAFPESVNLLHVDPSLSAGPVPGNGFVGAPPGVFLPPPIGGGGSPNTPSGNGCPPDQGTTSNCGTQNPPPTTPPPVPEPGTLVLVATGAAAILTRFRPLKK